MPYTSEQLQKIQEAIASGASTVKYGDKEVTYRTLNELKQIENSIKTETSPTTYGKGGRRFAQHSKGL